MGNINIKTLLEGDAIFEEFQGAITEQYVFQQLINNNSFDIYYWSAEKSTGELDFLIQYKGNIIPVEVKAEENLQAKRYFVRNTRPAWPYAVRCQITGGKAGLSIFRFMP